MLHIRHSAAGQIVRHRRRNALQSAVCSLLLLGSAALAALCSPLLQPDEEAACHFQGIIFTEPSRPQEEPSPIPKPPQQLTVSAPELQLPDTTVLQEGKSGITLTELNELEPQPKEDDFLEIIPELQAPATQHSVSIAPRQKPLRKGADVFIPPAYSRCPHPPYPSALHRQRAERTVGVLIQVAADGSPMEVKITQSSGIVSLDQHTRNWILKNWLFSPACKNGKPTAASVSTKLHYTLTS